MSQKYVANSCHKQQISEKIYFLRPNETCHTYMNEKSYRHINMTWHTQASFMETIT